MIYIHSHNPQHEIYEIVILDQYDLCLSSITYLDLRVQCAPVKHIFVHNIDVIIQHFDSRMLISLVIFQK